MKINSTFVAFLILSSCASSQDVTGPDGTHHKLITCSSLGKCYEKAAEVCNGQFEPVNTEINEIPGFNGTTTEEIKLLVKCGKHD